PEKYLEMRLDCEKASIRISLGGVARGAIEWSRIAHRPILKIGYGKGGQAREENGGRSRAFLTSKTSEFALATAEHLKAFIAETRGGSPSLTGAEHARELLRIVFAGYESAETGETVRL
ncbi:MAG: hypothetical protein M3Z09_11890, partial [Acidobacteriota bacterium]|nr:hypothetical protein [Acidobacteriota bacterium]